MTPDNTPAQPARPCSSLLVPQAGDDVENRARPSSPSPSGDEHESRVQDHHPKTPSCSSPGRAQTQDLHLIPTTSPAYPFARAYFTLRLEGQRLLDEATRQLLPIRGFLEALTGDRSSDGPRAGGAR